MGRRFIYERDAEDGWNLYVRDTLDQLYARDAYPEAEALFEEGATSHGANSHTTGGNRAHNMNSFHHHSHPGGHGNSYTFQSLRQQQGGNTVGGQAGGNSADGKSAMARRFAEAEAEAFLNGGAAKGGDSTTKGGNIANNHNQLKGDKFNGGHNTFNMQSMTQQKGGNTQGGNGGANSGKGGQGGSFSVPVSLPPMPMRRDAFAAPEMFYELYERDAFLDGGPAKGGDSTTKGGNQAHNHNQLKGDSFNGGHNTFNMQSMTQQKGGNTRGGRGGANGGNGGAGGSFSIPVSLPPMPMRRDALADPEVFYELHERDAYPDPEAEAEAEAEYEAELYARELDFYDEF